MVHSDQELEQALRSRVADCYKRDDLDALTVKRVRQAAEQELGVDEGFFKNDETWNKRSKDIINDEVTRQQSGRTADAPAEAVQQETQDVPIEAKRKASESKERAGKRQKRAISSSPKSSSLSPVPSDNGRPVDPIPTNPTKRQPPTAETDARSESELSEVFGDTPPPKARRKRQSAADGKPKLKAKSTKPLGRPSVSYTPQEEEIKRLQGWLIKCGIRKLWGKELARFETPGEKISHLKELLREVGMDGRFSEAKARQIKEERELKADLGEITERNKLWGQSESEDEGGGERRRLAKGLQEIQDLGGDEESD